MDFQETISTTTERELTKINSTFISRRLRRCRLAKADLQAGQTQTNNDFFHAAAGSPEFDVSLWDRTLSTERFLTNC